MKPNKLQILRMSYRGVDLVIRPSGNGLILAYYADSYDHVIPDGSWATIAEASAHVIEFIDLMSEES